MIRSGSAGLRTMIALPRRASAGDRVDVVRVEVLAHGRPARHRSRRQARRRRCADHRPAADAAAVNDFDALRAIVATGAAGDA
jgi:hypothetical protein